MGIIAILVTCLQWASFLTWLAFMICYHALTVGDWRKSENGRNIMGVALCFVLVFGLIVLGVTFGDFPGRPILQSLVYSMLIGFGLKRIQILFKVQRKTWPPLEAPGSGAQQERHTRLALEEDPHPLEWPGEDSQPTT